jgi:hypothetical protein
MENVKLVGGRDSSEKLGVRSQEGKKGLRAEDRGRKNKLSVGSLQSKSPLRFAYLAEKEAKGKGVKS